MRRFEFQIILGLAVAGLLSLIITAVSHSSPKHIPDNVVIKEVVYEDHHYLLFSVNTDHGVAIYGAVHSASCTNWVGHTLSEIRE